jgi:hypothetical protein
MTLHPIPLNFLIYEEIFFLLFYQCTGERISCTAVSIYCSNPHQSRKARLGLVWDAPTDKWMGKVYYVHYKRHGLDQRHSFFTRLFSGERILTKQAAIVKNSEMKG